MNVRAIASTYCPAYLRPAFDRIEASPLGLRLARGVFWSMAGAVISRGLMLVATVVVARLLGKTVYGELGMIQSTVGMFGTFAGFGLGLTATKHVAEFRQSDPARAGRILGLSAVVAAVTSGLMALALYFLAPWLAEHTINAPHLTGALRIGALILFISGVNGAQTGGLSGFEAFKTVAYVNLLVGLLSFPILICGAWLGGLTGAVWALLINLVFNWLSNHLALRNEARRFGVPFTLRECGQEWPILWTFSLPAVLAASMTGPITWACNAMLVNRPDGYAEMGILTAALAFQTILLFLSGMLNAPLLSLVSNSTGKTSERLQLVNILSSWMLGAFAAMPLLCFPEIGQLLFGRGYNTHTFAVTLSLVVLASCVMTFKSGLSRVLTANNLLWWGFVSNAFWAAILIASSLFLVRWGAPGLAASFLLAYTLNSAILLPLYYSRKLVPKGTLFSKAAILIWSVLACLVILNLLDVRLEFRATAFVPCVALGATAFKSLARPRDAATERQPLVDHTETPKSKPHVVKVVVDRDLCSGCGVCAGVCPADALPMRIRPNGDLAPAILQERCEFKQKCSLCLAVCPMAVGVHDPRPRNNDLFSPSESPGSHFNEHIGWYLRSIVGWRKDTALRRTSASGGLATWCLEKLLENGQVTQVASVRLAQKHDKGHFEFYSASSVEELRASAGSIYQPTDISNILREITKDKTQRWAVVGVPCLCAGIRNLKHLREQIPYVLGLACGMYQNTFYTELLLKQSGIDRRNVSRIDYRLEAEGGNASNYQFQGKTPALSGRRIPYHALPYFLGKHAYFRLNACNFCRDVFAETADACFMDAWLPEYSNDTRGTSLVVIRNQAIDAMFSSRSANLEIAWEPIVAGKTVRSQLGHVRRKREMIAARVGQTERTGNHLISSFSAEAIGWWLQKHTQQRSKHAWSRWGRKYGSGAFWIAMIDLVVLQKTLDAILRTTRLAKMLCHNVCSTTSKPADTKK